MLWHSWQCKTNHKNTYSIEKPLVIFCLTKKIHPAIRSKNKSKLEKAGMSILITTIQKQDFLVHLFSILSSRKPLEKKKSTSSLTGIKEKTQHLKYKLWPALRRLNPVSHKKRQSEQRKWMAVGWTSKLSELHNSFQFFPRFTGTRHNKNFHNSNKFWLEIWYQIQA